MPRLANLPNCAAPWTPEALGDLAEMLRAGQTIPEIAKIMGRSQEAIRNKAWRMGLLRSRIRKDTAPISN
jgi:hypothetical protein